VEKLAEVQRIEALREQQRHEREQQREAEQLQRQKVHEERRAKEMERDAKPPSRRKVRGFCLLRCGQRML